MPLYEYECQKCGERFEIIQKFSDEPLEAHAQNGGTACGGAVRKLLSAPAIQFKGTGWYVTDYGKGGEKPPKEQGGEASGKNGKSSSDGSGSAAKAKSRSGESKSAGKSSKKSAVAA